MLKLLLHLTFSSIIDTEGTIALHESCLGKRLFTFPAITLYIDLIVKVFEKNPETSFSEWGEVLRPIKDV